LFFGRGILAFAWRNLENREMSLGRRTHHDTIGCVDPFAEMAINA
jgi:hypothetical protein